MAELQPPVDGQLNGGGGGGGVAPMVIVPAEPVAGPTKRQRRPSVRLGEIGDQHTYDNHRRTKQQQWRYASKESKTSRTRQLMNLSGGGAMELHETLDGGDDKNGGNKSNHNNTGNNNSNNNNNPLDCVAIGSWKVRDSSKSKRGFSTTKRIRSNWGSKMDDGDEKFEDDVDFDDDDDDRDFDREGSASQLKEQSLNLSMDNERDLHYRSRDGIRVRVSDGVELDGPSDTDARNWNNNNYNNNNNNNPERNGVKVWLNQLGLGRYFPIFEVHEVDDEVLPLLTLEDLKDMGINAVGSRRKLFCSIQKLGKGFS